MAGRAVANRSDPITVATPRGQVEVVRQQWRSQRAGSGWQWEWLARRRGQSDWRQCGERATRSVRRRCCRRGSSLDGSLPRSLGQNASWRRSESKHQRLRERAGTPIELRPPAPVSPALSRQQRGAGKRRHGAARAGCRGRGSGAARRTAVPHGGRGWASMLATGFRSLSGVESAPARRTRCSAR